MNYDSTADTLRHIRRVQQLLEAFAAELVKRGQDHDRSKLGPVEKPVRDANPPDYSTVFGSQRARELSQALRPAIEHHHKVNSHHPEFYGAHGIAGMDLVDLVEMFLDWKAAGEPYPADNIARSLEINRERYGLEPQLLAILTNTARNFGWLDPADPAPKP